MGSEMCIRDRSMASAASPVVDALDLDRARASTLALPCCVTTMLCEAWGAAPLIKALHFFDAPQYVWPQWRLCEIFSHSLCQHARDLPSLAMHAPPAPYSNLPRTTSVARRRERSPLPALSMEAALLGAAAAAERQVRPAGLRH